MTIINFSRASIRPQAERRDHRLECPQCLKTGHVFCIAANGSSVPGGDIRQGSST
jgi:hypothetical protein